MRNWVSRRSAWKAALLGFLLLPSLSSALPGPTAPVASAQPAPGDIAETAAALGSFTKLTAAFQAAGLLDRLKAPGPLTLFGATDAAFDKLPPGTVQALLQDQPKLQAILLYHVVPSRLTSADVATLQTARTAQGANIMINVAPGIKINQATVVRADVAASNGIIHAIDAVLVPPDVTVPAVQAMPRAGIGDQELPTALPLLGLLLVFGGVWLRRGALAPAPAHSALSASPPALPRATPASRNLTVALVVLGLTLLARAYWHHSREH